MILLSVIVPFYNVEKYIEQCIRSLYDQDIPQEEYEVICVDDCSPDGSCTIVEHLLEEYSTLRLLKHDKNKKLGGARNTGIRAAQGKYVLFVDSDDYLLPNILKGLINLSEEEQLDFLHFDNVIDRNGKFVHDLGYSVVDTSVMTGVQLFNSPYFFWQTSHIAAWKKLYRRDFLLQNKLFFVEDTMYEDNDYCFRVYSVAQRTKHVGVDIYVYRINDMSITHNQEDLHKVVYRTRAAYALVNSYHQVRKICDNRDFLHTMSNFIRWYTDSILDGFEKHGKIDVLRKECRFRVYRFCPFVSLKKIISLYSKVYC